MVTTEFGPFTLGLRSVLRGDATALESAIDGNTVAVLLEPISRETGVLITPADYPRALREITAHHNVLVTADEFQSGLGCTGTPLPCDTVGVVLDSACSTLHARLCMLGGGRLGGGQLERLVGLVIFAMRSADTGPFSKAGTEIRCTGGARP